MTAEDFPATLGAQENSPCSARAWATFAALPDYRNIVEHVRAAGDTVVARGHSICSDARLGGPALWRAELRGGLLCERRLYEDTPDDRRQLGL